MISLVLRQTAGLPEDTRNYDYRVAGIDVSSDTPIEYLIGFQSVRKLPRQMPVESLPESAEKRNTVFIGTGWIGQAWRDVHCEISQQGYHVTLSGIGCFYIHSSGKQIKLLHKEPGCAPSLVEEALLGPPLILALAKHDIWCIHASAVVAQNHALLFTGQSGYGKSTIADYLDRNLTEEVVRIADDLVPVRLEDESLFAYTHYPQLKLKGTSQATVSQAERLPVAALYDLCKHEQQGLRLKRVDGRDAALTFVKHTISSRLFGAETLEHHLSFCATAARTVRVSTLCYPRWFAILPALGRLILADLSTLPVELNTTEY